MSTLSKIGKPLAAAALSAALAGPALAEDTVPYASPTDDPAAAEQAKADAAQQRADKLTDQGLTYKSSAVQSANAQANRMQSKADTIRAEQAGVEAAPPSPEMQAAEARLKMLRDTGGPAYKSGEVDRAQMETLKLTQPVVVEPSGPGQVPPTWDKPIIREGQEKMAPSQPD